MQSSRHPEGNKPPAHHYLPLLCWYWGMHWLTPLSWSRLTDFVASSSSTTSPWPFRHASIRGVVQDPSCVERVAEMSLSSSLHDNKCQSVNLNTTMSLLLECSSLPLLHYNWILMSSYLVGCYVFCALNSHNDTGDAVSGTPLTLPSQVSKTL